MSTMVLMRAEPAAADQRVVLRGVSWIAYGRLLAMRGPGRAVRIAYLEGEVELMSPGERHESVATMIGRLLSAYAVECQVPLNGRRSTTFRKRARARGLESDESYVLGQARKSRPDLAIEVVVASGGVDKLAIYHGLGVPEVWIWRRGRLRVHVLDADGYRIQSTSALLPDLDLGLFASFVEREDQTRAVTEYIAALRAGR
jgi:Uma2 family endonuclease